MVVSSRFFRRLTLVVACWLGHAALLRADVHGGIEIGAKGIRALAVDVPMDGTAPRVLSVDNHNTTLVADLAAKKRFSAAALDESGAVVKRLVQKLRQESKVPDERLYLVGSSGLFAPIEGDAALVQVNKAALADALRLQCGLAMDFVSSTREAELTIVSVVPGKFRDTALLLDIGSGNTKGGAAVKDSLATFGIPFGTVTFADRVRKEAGADGFAATASKLREKLLTPHLQDSVRGQEEWIKRGRVYLAGGAAWAMTTFMKPLDRRDFVALSMRDLRAYQQLLADHAGDLPVPDLSGGDDAARKLAAKDVELVRKTFTRDQLQAGAEILEALVDVFRLDAGDKEMFFARQAYIGWILGYTVDKATNRRRP